MPPGPPTALRAESLRSVEALLRELPGLRRAPQIPGALEAPARWPTGLAALDRLLGGGLPGGRLSEIAGPASSGRTSLALALLAATTRGGESAAVVDAADAFDPASAQAAGADLTRTLWVRARHPREALRAAALLARARGFALILLDLTTPGATHAEDTGGRHSKRRPEGRRAQRAREGEARPAGERSAGPRKDGKRRPERRRAQRGEAERRPNAKASEVTRLARSVAGDRAALVVLAERRIAGSCAELALEMRAGRARFTGTPPLLEALESEAVVVRHRGGPPGAAVRLHFRPPLPLP